MLYTLQKLYEDMFESATKYLHVQILLHVGLEGLNVKSETRPEMLCRLFVFSLFLCGGGVCGV